MNTIKYILFFLVVSYSYPATAGTYEQDAELMLGRLLHIDNAKYKQKNKDGVIFYNSLSEYKDWEKLYIKYSKLGKKNKSLTEVEMKNLLFIGFIAKANLDAAVSEFFSSDMVPIYNANKLKMLNTLSDLKFLIPSTCYFMNNYFRYEGRNINLKQRFIDKNKPILIKGLGMTEGKLCLGYLTVK